MVRLKMVSARPPRNGGASRRWALTAHTVISWLTVVSLLFVAAPISLASHSTLAVAPATAYRAHATIHSITVQAAAPDIEVNFEVESSSGSAAVAQLNVGYAANGSLRDFAWGNQLQEDFVAAFITGIETAADAPLPGEEPTTIRRPELWVA